MGQLRPHHKEQPWEEARQVVRCQACGAGLTALAHPIRHCVFCGLEGLQPTVPAGEWQRPGALLPFRLAAKDVVLAISWESRLSLAGLKSLWTGEAEKLVELEAVYLPFWSFDGLVESYRTATASGQPGKESLGWDSYEQVIVPASSDLARALLEEIYPFDLDALLPYDPEFLATAPARLYDPESAQAAETARSTMLDRSRSRLRRARSAPDFQVLGLTYQLILLPVWLGRLASTGTQRRVVVNGQSGRVALGPSLASA
jgi:hypothetical protein